MLHTVGMSKSILSSMALFGAASLVAACGQETADPGFTVNRCSDVTAAHCIQIPGGDTQALLEETNRLQPGTTLVLGAGTFALDNGITIRNADGVHIIGQGIEQTTLDFGPVTAQVNG